MVSGPDLLNAYRLSQTGGYDELLDGDGAPRRHWLPFLKELNALPEADRAARALRLDRRVRETGIAYDVFADPTLGSQQWQLDLEPIVFSSAEWRWLEAALIQRAELFDAVLVNAALQRSHR